MDFQLKKDFSYLLLASLFSLSFCSGRDTREIMIKDRSNQQEESQLSGETIEETSSDQIDLSDKSAQEKNDTDTEIIDNVKETQNSNNGIIEINSQNENIDVRNNEVGGREVDSKIEISNFIKMCPSTAEVEQFYRDFISFNGGELHNLLPEVISCKFIDELTPDNSPVFLFIYQILRVFKKAEFNKSLPWAVGFNNFYDWLTSAKIGFRLHDGGNDVLATKSPKDGVMTVSINRELFDTYNLSDWFIYPNSAQDGLLLLGQSIIEEIALYGGYCKTVNCDKETYPNEAYLLFFIENQRYFSFTNDELSDMKEYYEDTFNNNRTAPGFIGRKRK